MKKFKPLAAIAFALLAVLCTLSFSPPVSTSNASPMISYTPEPYVTVTMYALTVDGARRKDAQNNYITCSPYNFDWGCTALCDNRTILGEPDPEYNAVCGDPPRTNVYTYPYPTDLITVPVQTYYLLDVLSQEMAPNVYTHPASLRAQAVAARSYVWWQIENLILNPYYDIDSINNSAENYQVFIPYRFDKLRPRGAPMEPNIDTPCAAFRYRNANQERACEAIGPRHYLAQWEVDAPAFASFNADMYAQTRSNPNQSDRSYQHLVGVDDPISTACDSDNQGYYLDGMSQQGANRWVAGHECSSCYAAPVPGNAPGGPWSVTWTRPEQVLFHYYTRVHLRDADKDNEVLSPDWRWNPLDIRWEGTNAQPPAMRVGQSYVVTVTVQNTSVDDWDCHWRADRPEPIPRYYLRYRWLDNRTGDGSGVAGSGQAPVCNLSAGASRTVRLTINDVPGIPGPYLLKFDMYESTSDFWFSTSNSQTQPPGWPTYDVNSQVIAPTPVPTPTSCDNDC
jgi:hypothetical protein